MHTTRPKVFPGRFGSACHTIKSVSGAVWKCMPHDQKCVPHDVKCFRGGLEVPATRSKVRATRCEVFPGRFGSACHTIKSVSGAVWKCLPHTKRETWMAKGRQVTLQTKTWMAKGRQVTLQTKTWMAEGRQVTPTTETWMAEGRQVTQQKTPHPPTESPKRKSES